VLRLVKIVATFASGEFERVAAGREGPVSVQSAADERFFQPSRAALSQGGQALFGCADVVAPNGAGIDEQHSVGAKTFASGAYLVGILRGGAASIRAPAEFGGAEAGSGGLLSFSKGGLRIVAEQLRGVSESGERSFEAQEAIDGFSLLFAEEV